jgi:hypothetical protein
MLAVGAFTPAFAAAAGTPSAARTGAAGSAPLLHAAPALTSGGQPSAPTAVSTAPTVVTGPPAGAGALTLGSFMLLISVLLAAVATTTLWWMLHAWRTPEALRATGYRRREGATGLSFSLLVPARHEQAVLGDTLDSLAALDHPDYEVIVIIGHDDPET